MSNKTKIMIAAIATMLFAAPVAAASIDTSNPAFARTGNLTSIPVGHAEFCKTHRSDCGPNTKIVEAVNLTDTRWTQLLAVNQEYNADITPVTDQDLYHVAELWTYPQNGAGDCEDIALAKRKALIADGWPASTLLMSVVRQQNGEGHAVLMVRTDRGDLVLDNQDGLVRVWNDTPYHYLKRQSQTDQSEWVDIVDNRSVRVATTH